MNNESRVKPQPLQPEAKPFDDEEFKHRADFTRRLAADGGKVIAIENALRFIATIEEARREQPQELERLRAIEWRASEEYANAQPYRDPQTNELLNAGDWKAETVLGTMASILYDTDTPPDRREQPVRVTDAMVDAAELAYSAGPRWNVSHHRRNLRAAIVSALAAAPKEGTDG